MESEFTMCKYFNSNSVFPFVIKTWKMLGNDWESDATYDAGY